MANRDAPEADLQQTVKKYRIHRSSKPGQPSAAADSRECAPAGASTCFAVSGDLQARQRNRGCTVQTKTRPDSCGAGGQAPQTHQDEGGPDFLVGDQISQVPPTRDARDERQDLEQQLMMATLRAEQAERANLAKSRSLAAANHELRQPLQTLTLLQTLLEDLDLGEKALHLVEQMASTAKSMETILNALLDVEQGANEILPTNQVEFSIDELFERLKREFDYHAQARGIALRVAPCRLSVRSDPILLEQMLRNLLSNALKFTSAGKVLLGGRRRGGKIILQVLDSGMGVPADKLDSIFQEYVQLGNPTRDRSRGLGLGLSVVRGFGARLGYKVYVGSEPGKGSVFSIEGLTILCSDQISRAQATDTGVGGVARIEDHGRIERIEEERPPNSSVRSLVDFGIGLAAASRDGNRPQDWVRLGKPFETTERPSELEGLRALVRLSSEGISQPLAGALPAMSGRSPAQNFRGALFREFDATERGAESRGLREVPTLSRDRFWMTEIEARMRSSGISDWLDEGDYTELLVLIGDTVIEFAKRRSKLGGRMLAVPMPKPSASPTAFGPYGMVTSFEVGQIRHWRETAAIKIAGLTARQRQIMDLMLAGLPNKNIASELHISQRTVENHRASIMKRTSSLSLPDLARLAFALSWNGIDDPMLQRVALALSGSQRKR